MGPQRPPNHDDRLWRYVWWVRLRRPTADPGGDASADCRRGQLRRRTAPLYAQASSFGNRLPRPDRHSRRARADGAGDAAHA